MIINIIIIMEKKIINPLDDPNKVIQKNLENKKNKYSEEMIILNKLIKNEIKKNEFDRSCIFIY